MEALPHPHRLHYLDAARGLAVWLTILLHLQYAGWFGFNTSALAQFPFRLLWDGNLAILFFFVHSGFILTYRLQREYAGPGIRNYKAYALRRILRLYPPYLICLLAVFLVRHFSTDAPAFELSNSPWLRQYWTQNPEWVQLAGQSLLAVRIPNDPGMRLLPNDWTLTIECMASALLPLLAWGFRKTPFLLSPVVWSLVKFGIFDPFLLDFSFGVTIALYYDANWHREGNPGWIDALLCIAAGLCWLTVEHFPVQGENFAREWLIHPKGWSAAFIFLLLLRLKPLQRLLDNRILIFNGKLSYSLYLVHLPWLFFLWSDFAISWPITLRLLLFFIGTLFFSLTLHRFIERPCLALGRKWSHAVQKVG